MKYTRKKIIDDKYIIFIANEEEFKTLKRNGFKLTDRYKGVCCYSEYDSTYSSSSTKTNKGYFNHTYNNKILTIHDVELSRFPFKLTEENFLKLIRVASDKWKEGICETYAPEIFIKTFVIIKEDYFYKKMRKGFCEKGQKVLDEIFGTDVQEKPFPKFMKSKHDGTIVLFSEPKNGIVVKETYKYSLDYKSTDWAMDKFEDVEIEIIEKDNYELIVNNCIAGKIEKIIKEFANSFVANSHNACTQKDINDWIKNNV